MTEEDVGKLYIIYPAEHPGHLSEAAQAGVFVLLPHPGRVVLPLHG